MFTAIPHAAQIPRIPHLLPPQALVLRAPSSSSSSPQSSHSPFLTAPRAPPSHLLLSFPPPPGVLTPFLQSWKFLLYPSPDSDLSSPSIYTVQQRGFFVFFFKLGMDILTLAEA